MTKTSTYCVSTSRAPHLAWLAGALCALLLGACTKEGTPQPNVDDAPQVALPKPAPPAVAPVPAPPQPRVDTGPRADTSTADTAYVKLDSGVALMNLYYGMTQMPVDIGEIASQVSADYRNTSDEFRRKDLLVALEPRIRADIAAAMTHRYITWEVNGMPIEHYAAQDRRFPIKQDIWNGDSHFYWNDNANYQMSFTADEPLHGITVTDETAARQIEERVSKFQPLRLRLYAFAQSADLNQKLVKAKILKVELLDDKGRVLATQAG